MKNDNCYTYICGVCGLTFNLFRRSKIDPTCKKCLAIRDRKKYQMNHKQELAKKRKVYYQKNKSKILLYNAKWRREHPEERKVQQKKWRANYINKLLVKKCDTK